MGDMRWKWTDAHFCSLSSQTNVYGLTKVSGNEGTNKVIVAPLDGRVISIEYTQRDKRLTPSTKYIQFTYIPGGYSLQEFRSDFHVSIGKVEFYICRSENKEQVQGDLKIGDAEIVSVDVISNCHNSHGIVVGITFFKLQEKESKPASQFLNLYSSCQSGEETNLDVVAQGCQSLELSFVPYQLIHTNLISGNTEETVFLLSGGDNKMHLYKEVSENHKFEEVASEEYFPEFLNITSSVLQTTILNLDKNERRLTAMGHQDGLVKLSLVDAVKKEILQTWSTEHDSPITCLKLFTPETNVPCPPYIETTCSHEENGNSKSVPKDKTYNLVVTSALDAAVVYRNLMTSGFTDFLSLPGSENFDCPMCACVVDIDFDGEHEILIGTYGQELLAYKYVCKKHLPQAKENSVENTSDTEDSNDTYLPSNETEQEGIPLRMRKKLELVLKDSSQNDVDGHHDDTEQLSTGFHLLWQRSFPCPVMGLDCLDITGDGIEELIVVTLKGLHILQPDLNEVSEVMLERLRILTDTGSDIDDAYRILQTETFGK